MTATVHVTTEITEFAQRVREQLADLPAEEVDDLIDGLEADLAEAFAEVSGYELPAPEEYALELRNAAGLPPAEVRPGPRHSLGGLARSIRLTGGRMRATPATAAVVDFLVSLRPFWWVARAVIAYLFAVWMTSDARQMVPHSALQWAVMAVLVVISVQWGRGQWRTRWMKWPLIIGNVVALIVLGPVLRHQADQTLTWPQAKVAFGFNPGGPAFTVQEPLAGVQLNGKEVTNIFAYGADGKVLKNVQLFDQDGRPLATSVPGGNGCLQGSDCEDGGEDGAGVWLPSVLETGAKSWNVFPMQMVLAKFEESTGERVPDPAAKPEDRTAPFLKVPAVLSSTQKTQGKVVKGNG